MRLSVIVPVYQSAACLERCVRSITTPPCPEMELILIDDGSTDGSGELCDRLAAADSRIKVIHRPNGGLSAARNSGIGASTGEYITFVDSDDELAPGTLSDNMACLDAYPGTDLLEYPIHVHYGSKRQYLVTPTARRETGGKVFADWISEGGNTHAYACNKIYRRELFNEIRFPEGETFEDIAVCPSIVSRCRSICYSGKGLYLYYDNTDGITAHYSFKRQEPLFRHNLELLTQVSRMGMDTESARLWAGCLNLLTDLGRCRDTDPGYLDKAASSLSKLRPSLTGIISAGAGIKAVLKHISATILGVSVTCRMLSRNKLPL